MKYCLIILLFISFAGASQDYCKKKEFVVPEWTKAIVCLGGAVITEAIADGLYYNGQKPAAHFVGALSTGLLLSYPIWGKLTTDGDPFWAIPAYICFRVALFDPIYNHTRGLPISYVGSTSTWDNMVSKVNPGDGLMFMRAVVLTFGIRLTFEL